MQQQQAGTSAPAGGGTPAAGETRTQAAARRASSREYTVLELVEGTKAEGATIKVVGVFPGKDGDDACWTAIERDKRDGDEPEAWGLHKRALEGGRHTPRLKAVAGDLFDQFEAFALEPVQDVKRVKGKRA